PREGKKITELEKRINVKFEQLDVPEASSIQNQRLKNWADGIINTQPTEQARQLFGEIEKEFAELSKEELLTRLITAQFGSITPPSDIEDLNESIGGSPEKRDRSKFNRYFINMGSIDGMSK